MYGGGGASEVGKAVGIGRSEGSSDPPFFLLDSEA